MYKRGIPEMNKLLSVIVAVLIAVSAGCASVEEKAVDKPGIEKSSLVTLLATVEAVNHETRTLALRGDDGKLVTLHVSEEARNLEQVDVGDTVEVEFYESIALFTQEPTGDLGIKENVTATRTPLGDKPGIAAAETVEITVTVSAIDHETRMVTLKGPEGKTFTTHVGEGAKRLDEVKQGDELVARYTRAFAITVREP
jgi:hypothetical protein